MRKLATPEELKVIEYIPYKSFKEKVRLNKSYRGKTSWRNIKDLGNGLMVENTIRRM